MMCKKQHSIPPLSCHGCVMEELHQVRLTLEWYAQGVDSDTVGRYDGHDPDVLKDDGQRAREALAGVRP